MTREEAIAAGFTEEAPAESAGPKTMSRADAMAAGFTEPAERSPETQAKMENVHGPIVTGALNAADSASFAGIPTVLGAWDALGADDSAKESGSKTLGPTPGFGKMGFRDRYYANKKFYEDGMKRMGDTNPKSAIAGQVAGVVIPALASGGTAAANLPKASALVRAGRVAASGAKFGAAGGAMRGDSKLLGTSEEDPDIKGVIKDAAVGAAVGAPLALAGAGLGKVIGAPAKWIAKKGAEGLERFRGRAEGLTREELGRAAEIQQAGQGARRNLGVDEDAVAELENRLNNPFGMNKTVAGRKAVGKGVDDEGQLELARRAVKGDVDRANQALDELIRHGGKASRGHDEIFAQNEEELRKAATAAIPAALGKAGGTIALGAGAAMVHPLAGAMVGWGGRRALHDAAMAVIDHPAVAEQFTRLAPVQKALSQYGIRAGALSSKNAAAYALTLAKKDPEIAKLLLSVNEKRKKNRNEQMGMTKDEGF